MGRALRLAFGDALRNPLVLSQRLPLLDEDGIVLRDISGCFIGDVRREELVVVRPAVLFKCADELLEVASTPVFEALCY